MLTAAVPLAVQGNGPETCDKVIFESLVWDGAIKISAASAINSRFTQHVSRIPFPHLPPPPTPTQRLSKDRCKAKNPECVARSALGEIEPAITNVKVPRNVVVGMVRQRRAAEGEFVRGGHSAERRVPAEGNAA